MCGRRFLLSSSLRQECICHAPWTHFTRFSEFHLRYANFTHSTWRMNFTAKLCFAQPLPYLLYLSRLPKAIISRNACASFQDRRSFQVRRTFHCEAPLRYRLYLSRLPWAIISLAFRRISSSRSEHFKSEGHFIAKPASL